MFTREEVEEFFNDMDRDFDKRLSFEEFLGEESHIEKVFKSMDKNGDGFVTKAEFHDVCKNLTEDQVVRLEMFGENNCRTLQVAIAFSQFDTSGDDKLNYREFCLMIIQREQERSGQAPSAHSHSLSFTDCKTLHSPNAKLSLPT